MLATNHAVTGALIGLTIENPVIAVPAAFLSHFALDAIPHFDPPGTDIQRISSRRFIYQLLADAAVCGVLVMFLALTHPRHWVVAALCAFAAASPDFMWVTKFLYAQKTGKNLNKMGPIRRFHSWIQWYTSPKLLWFEASWFIVMCSQIALKIK